MMKIVAGTVLFLLPVVVHAQTVVVSQIHNASGWKSNTNYSPATGPKTRVNNGPGWNPATNSYVPGQPLAAYELTSDTCISGSAGGPSGTGAGIADGTCTWKYLSTTDYISITGWEKDAPAWQAGPYNYFAIVAAGSPLRAYSLQDTAGCANSTAAPTGNAVGVVVTMPDGCKWQWRGDIIYTSGASRIPHQTYVNGNTQTATIRMVNDHKAELWNDREYIAGQNGEANPIKVQYHNDHRYEGGLLVGCSTTRCPHIIVTTAAGESFRDSVLPTDPLTGYDLTKGVAIRNTTKDQWPYPAAGLSVGDNYVDITGLQIKADLGTAIDGKNTYANYMSIDNSIMHGGASPTVGGTTKAGVSVDYAVVISNSLIVSGGRFGAYFKYPGFLINSTVVGVSPGNNLAGVHSGWNWNTAGQTVANTAISGFLHAASSTEVPGCSTHCVTWYGISNVTDTPANDTGSFADGSVTEYVWTIPGTTYGATGMFRAAGDYRSAGPLLNSGAAFGTFTMPQGMSSAPNLRTYNRDTPDILKTVRPGAGGFDIGAYQTAGATPPPLYCQPGCIQP